MNCLKPHFLLFCDGNYPSNEQSTAAAAGGKSAVASNSRWRFVLEDIHSGTKFEANDREVGAAPDRTALVAVLRGLEALEQPSRVTLVTTSRYVFRGLQYGLTEWRENDYSWEHFGSVQPIRPITAEPKLVESQLQPVCVVSRPNTVNIPSTSGTKHRIDSGATIGGVANALEPSNRTPTAIFKDTCSSMHVAGVVASIHPHPGDPTNKLAFPRPTDQDSKSNLQNVEALPANSSESARTPKKRGCRNLRPFRWTVSLTKAGICWAWNLLLGIDEGIESYLRCLFLMDPTNRRRR